MEKNSYHVVPCVGNIVTLDLFFLCYQYKSNAEKTGESEIVSYLFPWIKDVEFHLYVAKLDLLALKLWCGQYICRTLCTLYSDIVIVTVQGTLLFRCVWIWNHNIHRDLLPTCIFTKNLTTHHCQIQQKNYKKMRFAPGLLTFHGRGAEWFSYTFFVDSFLGIWRTDGP